MPQKPGEPSWRYRRTMIYSLLVWGCYQLYTLVDAEDTRLNETLAFGWQTIIAILVVGYTGFATAQDIAAIWTTRTARPYADPPVEPTPVPPEVEVVVNPPQKDGLQ